MTEKERVLHGKIGNRALKIQLISPTSTFLSLVIYRPTLKEHYACSEGSVVDADEHLGTNISF